jgi:hypothetical protein
MFITGKVVEYSLDIFILGNYLTGNGRITISDPGVPGGRSLTFKLPILTLLFYSILEKVLKVLFNTLN